MRGSRALIFLSRSVQLFRWIPRVAKRARARSSSLEFAWRREFSDQGVDEVKRWDLSAVFVKSFDLTFGRDERITASKSCFDLADPCCYQFCDTVTRDYA